MPAISINGSSFEYVEKGSGVPVVFVHGGISDYRIWEKQMEPFSQQYHIIAYSRRYHYPNPWQGDGSDYSISLHARDLAGFIRALGLDNVNLIGNSYGAYTALMTAINNPELVKTLVLNEPPVLTLLVSNPDNPFQILAVFMRDFSTGKSFMNFGLNHMKPATKALKNDEMEKGVRLFAEGALGNGEYEEIPDEVKAIFMDNAAALKAELLGPGFPQFPKDKARLLATPSLLVYGEHSPKFLCTISDLLLKILPHSEKVIIPNASHLTHRQNPNAYNRNALEFLSKYN
jgi:pimeloyl-ACP methyl ester carboxylesterase